VAISTGRSGKVAGAAVAEAVGAAIGELAGVGLPETTVLSAGAHETTMSETTIEANGRRISEPNLEVPRRQVI